MNRIWLFLILGLFFGCNDDTKQKKEAEKGLVSMEETKEAQNPKPVTLPPLVAQEAIYDSVGINGVPSHTYAAYVPEGWKQGQDVILFLDPQGEGWTPVGKYKELGQASGLVLIGANNSRNGMQWGEQSAALDLLLGEIRSRFTLGSGKVHLVGFSGGARVGALLCRNGKGISTWIGCGAAFDQPGVVLPDSLRPTLVCGWHDLNYPEIISEYQRLQKAGKRIGLLHFEGKHAWPNPASLKEALQVSGLIDLPKDLDLSDPNQKKFSFLQRLAAFRRLNSFLPLLPGPKQTAAQTQIQSYQNSGQLEADRQAEGEKLAAAQQRHDQWIQDMDLQDLAWWKGTLQMARKVPKGDPTYPVFLGQDLSFLGLIAFLKADQAVRQGMSQAEAYLDLYALIEPDNTEVDFLRAYRSARAGDLGAALSHLENAVARGFYRADRLLTEDVFQALQSQNPVRFQQVLKKANSQKH